MDTETAPGIAAKGRTAKDLSVPSPYRSLQAGQWVKVICGASYQDMPTVRQLVMLYALAGMDCIDVAADGAVVAAARRGLTDAVWLTEYLGGHSYLQPGLPWLMVSLNDSEDPHFRKAFFDASQCPPDCDRPCESICPTAAIQFPTANSGGVIADLCYGCGRCIPICPIDAIEARPYLARPEAFPRDQLCQVDAIEIHTQTGHQAQFAELWQRLQPWMPYLKLVSISCPDHEQVVPYLQELHNLMAPLDVPLIWQTDGRPMSGDLGKGTTHAAIRLAQKILAAGLPGHVQPAGGTNRYTVDKLLELGLVDRLPATSRSDPFSQNRFSTLTPPTDANAPTDANDLGLVPNRISGIAYGSYARSQLLPLLGAIDHELQPWLGNASLGQPPQGQRILPERQAMPLADAPWQRLDESALGQGLVLARELVGQLKAAHV